jgi:RNA polymerase sigma-70 factor, ECF subfamily
MTHQAFKNVSSEHGFLATGPAATTEPGWDWAAARRSCVREARRVLACPAAAEDAAQEALIRLWLTRYRRAQLDRPEAWLARVARNEALRVGAKLARRDECGLVEEAVSAPERGADPDAIVDRVAVDQLLAHLSPGDRELYRLRYREDLSQTDIADHLGVPDGTVKVRLHRLRGRLHDLTEESP